MLGKVAQHYALRPEPAEFLHVKDGGLVVLGRYRGTARQTGRPLDAAFAHVLRIAGNRIVGWLQVTDTVDHDQPGQDPRHAVQPH